MMSDPRHRRAGLPGEDEVAASIYGMLGCLAGAALLFVALVMALVWLAVQWW